MTISKLGVLTCFNAILSQTQEAYGGGGRGLGSGIGGKSMSRRGFGNLSLSFPLFLTILN